jgi:uncharacterized protein (UPF0332 family)
VTAAADARAHLEKAREFLEAARSNQHLGLHNAAASDAVVSGVNAKDAICLRLVGKTQKSEDHRQAVEELKHAGPAGAELASTLSRLLRLKTKAQYQTASVAASDAARAVEWAARMVEAAEQVVSSR